VRAPTGVAERGGLRVQRRVAVLDPAVVSPAEQFAVEGEQGRADGDPAFGLPEQGFLAGGGQHERGIGGLHEPTFTGGARLGKFPDRVTKVSWIPTGWYATLTGWPEVR
jgi:hypothetical protein